MAYRRSTASRRSTRSRSGYGARRSARTSYGRRSASPRKRSVKRSSARAQTVRIVVEMPSAQNVAFPGVKPVASAPRKAKF